MDNKSNKWGVLNEFFSDINVNFPQKPQLIGGISIYVAPNGLGIQYRGGSERLIIKGKNSVSIWRFLSEKLTGKNSLEQILDLAQKCNVDCFDVATFLKTLHSYHLLSDSDNEICVENDHHFDLFSIKQKEYYDRIIGYSGRNSSSIEVFDRIKNSKILIITNEIFVPMLCYNMHLAGFKDLGFLILTDDNSINALEYIDNINLLTYKNITNVIGEELRNLLNSTMDDYHYVLSVINNPSNHFLNEVSRFCSLKNKPMLNVSIVENSYEIGPFFFPNSDTACVSCYHLRKQSYDNHSFYDYLYQRDLDDRELKFDNKMKGFDIQGFLSVLNIVILQLKNSIAKIAKPTNINQCIKLNPLSLNIIRENVIQVPGCPSCSNHKS